MGKNDSKIFFSCVLSNLLRRHKSWLPVQVSNTVYGFWGEGADDEHSEQSCAESSALWWVFCENAFMCAFRASEKEMREAIKNEKLSYICVCALECNMGEFSKASVGGGEFLASKWYDKSKNGCIRGRMIPKIFKLKPKAKANYFEDKIRKLRPLIVKCMLWSLL